MTHVAVLTLHRLAAVMGRPQQEHFALGMLGVAGAGNGISALELSEMLQPGGPAVLQSVCDAPGILADAFSARL